MESGLKRCLMEVFYCLKSFEGEQRELQFKLIEEQFDIVYWRNRGDKNYAQLDGEINPYFDYRVTTTVEVPYFIVKFRKPQVRGRRKVTFADQYATIEASGSTMPRLTCRENTAVDTGEFGLSLRGHDADGWEKALHPHISGNSACLGAFENMMFKEAQTNPVGYMSLLSKFYRTWNVASAYWDINNMRPLYSLPDEEGNRKRLLPAIIWERLRQFGFSSSRVLQLVLPHLPKGFNLSRYIRAIEVLGQFEYGFGDSMYGWVYPECVSRAKKVDAFQPIWQKAHQDLIRMNEQDWRYYRQTMPMDAKRKLREMYYAVHDYFDTDLLAKYGNNFRESMEHNTVEMLEELQSYGSGTLSDLRESNDMRREWLFHPEWIDYWMPSESECAEYLSCSIPYRKTAAKYAGFKEPDGEMARFWPEETLDLLKEQKFECGKTAIKKLEKQREEILNEIKTLNSNPIEDKILQQQISF